MNSNWNPFRFLRTVSHIPTWQLGEQFRVRVRSRVGQIFDPSIPSRNDRIHSRYPSEKLARTFRWHYRTNQQDLNWARDFARGNVTLLNRQLQAPIESFPWDWSGFGRLWQFELHYLDALPLLVATGDENDLSLANRLLEHWRAANPPSTGSGFGPYPTSKRMLNMSRCLCMLENQSSFRKALTSELAVSFQILWPQQENHIRANHLLTNLHALGASAWFLGEGIVSEKQRTTLEAALESEWKEQFLPDGGHYERSPGYHAALHREASEYLLMLGQSTDNGGKSAFGKLKELVPRTRAFLQQVCHPDGRPAFFHDSNLAMPRYRFESDPAQSKDGVSHAQDSGFVSYSSATWYGILFSGSAGPEYQPGHCHCDALSVELSYEGERLITNAGVAGYAEAHDRKWMREVAAHSTVEVLGRQQHEVWSSFRVGFRGAPVTTETIVTADESAFCASFDYYGKPPIRHSREVCFSHKENRVAIIDRLASPNQLDVVSRFHLHPDFTFDPETNSVCGRGHTFIIEPVNAETYQGHSTWMPEFGLREAQQTILLKPKNPSHFGLVLST